MAPKAADVNGILFESDAATPDMALDTVPVMQADKQPRKYVWRNIILFAYLHMAALYGGYLFLLKAKWLTCIFGKFIIQIMYTSHVIREHNRQRKQSLLRYWIVHA